MSKLKVLTTATDHYKAQAKAVLNEVIDEAPDSVIVLYFYKTESVFRIKASAIQDRLTLIGALEEAKAKVISDGYIQ